MTCAAAGGLLFGKKLEMRNERERRLKVSRAEAVEQRGLHDKNYKVVVTLSKSRLLWKKSMKSWEGMRKNKLLHH